MSNLCRPVEKITESLVGDFISEQSFKFTINDKRMEVVTPSVGPLLAFSLS